MQTLCEWYYELSGAALANNKKKERKGILVGIPFSWKDLVCHSFIPVNEKLSCIKLECVT